MTDKITDLTDKCQEKTKTKTDESMPRQSGKLRADITEFGGVIVVKLICESSGTSDRV